MSLGPATTETHGLAKASSLGAWLQRASLPALGLHVTLGMILWLTLCFRWRQSHVGLSQADLRTPPCDARDCAAADPAGPGVPHAPPTFMDRLPSEKRGRLWAFATERQYVLILANRGEGLLLMRLGDAIEHCRHAEGLQVIACTGSIATALLRLPLGHGCKPRSAERQGCSRVQPQSRRRARLPCDRCQSPPAITGEIFGAPVASRAFCAYIGAGFVAQGTEFPKLCSLQRIGGPLALCTARLPKRASPLAPHGGCP